MRDALFHIDRTDAISLQGQIRKSLISAIVEGQLSADEPVPSSRRMAKSLGVSRNTVVLAYQQLVDDGFLVSRERSGFYVSEEARMAPPGSDPRADADRPRSPPRWHRRLATRPAGQENISKPEDWRSYPYPFIYGQADSSLFPIAEWRDCARQVLGARWVGAWTGDTLDRDDPVLVEQVRKRLLPRRGIMATESEILITLGAQNAIYLTAALLIRQGTTVGMEEPGYPDARNIFRLTTDKVTPLPVDGKGIRIDGRIAACDIVYVTPSHQFPTTVTLPIDRRKALLELAHERDILLIEDDYEFETNYVNEVCPALKSLDADDRVIYVGSLSKSLFPGLRLGFLVGPAAFIAEARALRRLMVRHPPSNNQRTAALFLAQGHHDMLIRRLHRVYRGRWRILGDALREHMPDSSRPPSFGGASYWVRGPDRLDAEVLTAQAAARGVLIEPGRVYFGAASPPRNRFRLGFSSIGADRIEPGIKILAELVEK